MKFDKEAEGMGKRKGDLVLGEGKVSLARSTIDLQCAGIVKTLCPTTHQSCAKTEKSPKVLCVATQCEFSVLVLGLDIQDDLGRHEVGMVDSTEKEPINGNVGCRFKAEFKINKVSSVGFAVRSFQFEQELYKLTIFPRTARQPP